MRQVILGIAVGTFSVACLLASAQEQAAVGKRPYELDWAGRLADDHAPLVDFEGLEGWTVAAEHAEATFGASREQQIWGEHVGKLTYRAIGSSPVVRLRPPQPVPIAATFDAVSCWIYGNNISGRDKTTPPVTLAVDFIDAAGAPFSVLLRTVNWKEWYLCHRRLTQEQIGRVRHGGAFTGFTITRGTNKQDRLLFFDNLAVFAEPFVPLTFEPRPERGVRVFAGRDHGLNTGPGTLPFPTRAETIIPRDTAADATVKLVVRGEKLVFQYHSADGDLRIEVPTTTCAWDDLRWRWTGRGDWIHPCNGGGIFLVGNDGEPEAPHTAALRGLQVDGASATCRWRVTGSICSATVETRYWLCGKSLVLDLQVTDGKFSEKPPVTVYVPSPSGSKPEGVVSEVRFGKAIGFEQPRLVTIPYYTYGQTVRPAVVVDGPAERPLFLMGHIDWTLSNASTPWADNRIDKAGVTYNGGVRYVPKTNGIRNSCYERFVLTMSPRFEDVLPVIPNPVSPWKHVTGTRVWRAHGAGNREHDIAHWRKVQRYGMTEVVVTDHETGWRDGEESFTFRTRAAPAKGGDEGQLKYARIMQDELGFVYGPYNNFTDFAPVNEFWHVDMVSRQADNQLQTAWRRCYAPKPARAVEYCAKLAPIIESKFHFSTAYCDVHTAVTPWSRTDHDYRAPGAGTFAAVFYAFGEIMLLQKKAWDGPVYSEGNNHFPYCGLTDGNYAQDQRYRLPDNPWLVDFDLRRLHDLCCNFGMGNPGMFYGRNVSLGGNRQELDASIDRFLAATVAFGHPGFLVSRDGYHNTLRSYYMLQQLHSRYTLGSVRSIHYVSADGQQLDTTAAVASGVFRRSQIVTHYDNGCTTVVNGHRTERLRTVVDGRDIDLPPNGYTGWTDDGGIYVFSADADGHRADYADASAYLYVDGRGRFTRFEKAASDGIGICRVLPDGRYEVIPYADSDCGFAVAAARAEALDEARHPVGEAHLRRSRGLTYVVPVEGAFSYVLSGEARPDAAALTSAADTAIAGQTLRARGDREHEVVVPLDSKPGDRIWRQFEGKWIDFTVVPLCRISARLADGTLAVSVASNLRQTVAGVVTVGDSRHDLDLPAGQPVEVRGDLPQVSREQIEPLPIVVEADGLRRETGCTLLALSDYRQLTELPTTYRTGMRLRGGEETAILAGYGSSVYPQSMTCGGVQRRALRMHPPYKQGVGYSAVVYDAVALPTAANPVLRALVGKGDGSDLGDGILYRLVVIDARGTETRAGEQKVEGHKWLPIEVDLSRWTGTSIGIKLVTDVGEDDNSSGDWGCWADLRIETKDKTTLWQLVEDQGAHGIGPGPNPLPAVTAEQLRAAHTAWLHYDGAGLEGPGSTYETYAVVNGMRIGPMARAGGNPREGVWAEDCKVELTTEAVATLSYRNVFRLENPGQDWFKVRRFWLEVELADGRRCSSHISTGVFTQPPEWTYCEGVGVAHDRDIEVNIWFP